MRWQGQTVGAVDEAALPGMEKRDGLVRSVTTPEFAGITFHEVMSRSALNHVPGASDMPFDWTINPYRGCSHACVYCLAPHTRILLADGRQRAIGELRVGDLVMGTRRDGMHRRYTPARILAVWRSRKRAYRITLADGTEITASADHRFLTERGWKHVADSVIRRPHLTTRNRMLGFGRGGPLVCDPRAESSEYRRGYLTGMIRRDGMILHKAYDDGTRVRTIHRFRLALADREALERTASFLLSEGVETTERPLAARTPTRRPMDAILAASRDEVAAIEAAIVIPDQPTQEWNAGLLAGIFDAEGSCSPGILRIATAAEDLLAATESALEAIDIPYVREPARPNGVPSIRVRGGLAARQRFFSSCAPAITRKLALAGTAVTSAANLRVLSVEDLGHDLEMVDISTDTEDFVAEGVISHNCFARGTHTYLDLDGGRDFDSQIIVKVNVADVLRKELRRGSWRRETVALGTNTDPYQRAEGRYRLMPRIIGELADSGTPFSILTKGTLLRRDLPLLRDAAGSVDVSLAMSIAIYDDALQQSIEPGTPSTAARLETVRAATEAGFHVAVFMMPVLPHLTDSVPALEEAVRRIADAGAHRVVFGALHLRAGVKPWFFTWLGHAHPELVTSYRRLYPGAAAEAPKEYRRWLAARLRPLLRRHGLDRPASPFRETKPPATPEPARLF